MKKELFKFPIFIIKAIGVIYFISALALGIVLSSFGIINAPSFMLIFIIAGCFCFYAGNQIKKGNTKKGAIVGILSSIPLFFMALDGWIISWVGIGTGIYVLVTSKTR